MVSTGHTLTQNKTSEFIEDRRQRSGTKITARMRAVVDMHLGGSSTEVIAEALGYAGSHTVRNVLNNPKARALIQQVMDYYDQSFQLLYPEVISAVSNGLQSVDEKVQLESSKIWLKSHGKMNGNNSDRDKAPVNVENMIANILIQASNKGDNDSRGTSDRESVQDSRQRKTDRRFQIESQSEEV